MALLFLDGFEGYPNPQYMVQMHGVPGWTGYFGGQMPVVDNVSFRTTQVTAANSRGLRTPITVNNTSAMTLSLPNLTEVIIGFGFATANANTSSLPILSLYNNAIGQGILLVVDGLGRLVCYTPTGTGAPSVALGLTSTLLANSVWVYLEVRVKLGAANGEFEVRCNGIQVLNLTGINTAAGGISSYATLLLGYLTSNIPTFWYYDDLYVCDTTGAANNTFIGPLSVYSLVPTGPGSSTNMTVTGAATNWQANADSNDATYVTTIASGDKDYYTFQSLPGTVASVAGCMLVARGKSVYTTARKLYLKFKNGVNVITSAAKTLTISSFYYENFVSDTAPDGTPWTPTNVNSTEAGTEGS